MIKLPFRLSSVVVTDPARGELYLYGSDVLFVANRGEVDIYTSNEAHHSGTLRRADIDSVIAFLQQVRKDSA